MILLLMACTGTVDDGEPRDTQDTAPVETGSPDDTGIGDDTGDTSDTDDSGEDTAPRDEDGDGYPAGEDCDDDDASINPGAPELFDGFDNDCDGVVDAMGSYGGELRIQLRAWYQNTPYDFTLTCPTSMERELVDLDFEVSCTTDTSDDKAQLLIGAELILSPVDGYLWELDEWEGDVLITSTNGWDTTGEGEIVWTDMEHVSMSVSLDTVYMEFNGYGDLGR